MADRNPTNITAMQAAHTQRLTKQLNHMFSPAELKSMADSDPFDTNILREAVYNAHQRLSGSIAKVHELEATFDRVGIPPSTKQMACMVGEVEHTEHLGDYLWIRTADLESLMEEMRIATDERERVEMKATNLREFLAVHEDVERAHATCRIELDDGTGPPRIIRKNGRRFFPNNRNNPTPTTPAHRGGFSSNFGTPTPRGPASSTTTINRGRSGFGGRVNSSRGGGRDGVNSNGSPRGGKGYGNDRAHGTGGWRTA